MFWCDVNNVVPRTWKEVLHLDQSKQCTWVPSHMCHSCSQASLASQKRWFGQMVPTMVSRYQLTAGMLLNRGFCKAWDSILDLLIVIQVVSSSSSSSILSELKFLPCPFCRLLNSDLVSSLALDGLPLTLPIISTRLNLLTRSLRLVARGLWSPLALPPQMGISCQSRRAMYSTRS